MLEKCSRIKVQVVAVVVAAAKKAVAAGPTPARLADR